MTPVYINVFNRLTTTRNLCEQIAKLKGAEVVIIDNASSWEPLLDWYAECPYEVIRLRENLGHHAPWLCGAVSQDSAPFYCVTDCDLDIDGVSSDVLSVLASAFDWRSGKPVKSGLSLRIDDLPPWQREVAGWEARFWKRQVANDSRFYHGEIDTTFAMYESTTPQSVATRVSGVPSVRLGPPYSARHMPWYLDCLNLDSENENYFATASRSNSWKPAGQSLSANYT